jgi:hypothetical protein
MINCPKCGNDNMIGAIFCRSCGDKLNLNEISPDVFDAPKVPASVKLIKILQRLLLLVFLVAVVALVTGLFLPVTIAFKGDLEQGALDVSQRKYAALQNPSAKTPNQIPFSSDEATAVVSQSLGLPGTGTGNKKPQLLSVEFLASGNCKFILKTLLFGQVPMCTTVVAKPSVSGPGKVRLDVLRASIGKLPLPGALKKQGAAQFSALNLASVFALAESRVQAINVTDGKCEITIVRP